MINPIQLALMGQAAGNQPMPSLVETDERKLTPRERIAAALAAFGSSFGSPASSTILSDILGRPGREAGADRDLQRENLALQLRGRDERMAALQRSQEQARQDAMRSEDIAREDAARAEERQFRSSQAEATVKNAAEEKRLEREARAQEREDEQAFREREGRLGRESSERVASIRSTDGDGRKTRVSHQEREDMKTLSRGIVKISNNVEGAIQQTGSPDGVRKAFMDDLESLMLGDESHDEMVQMFLERVEPRLREIEHATERRAKAEARIKPIPGGRR